MTRAEVEQLVIAKARACGIDERLAVEHIRQESSFNPRALGPMTKYGKAKGLAQFIDATARRYGVQDPFDPNQALDGWCRYMSDLLKRFGGDYRLALAAYHSGEGAARAALNNCQGNPKTCNYVATILSRAGRSGNNSSSPGAVGGTGGTVATSTIGVIAIAVLAVVALSGK